MTRAKCLIGNRGVRWLSLALRPWLRCLSYIPLQGIRLATLRIFGSTIDKDVVLEPGVVVLSPWQLFIGSQTNIARGVYLDARGCLRIGSNVNISEEVAIWTAEHDVQSSTFQMTREPVVIEDYAWLGFRSVILPGLTIGRGAVVATGAVVTKSVPAYTMVGGVPAKIIGSRNPDLTYHLGNHPNSD